MNIRSRRARALVACVVWSAAVAALAVACGDGESPAAPAGVVVVQQPSIVPGDAIPVPDGDIALTLKGKIAAHNAGDNLELDVPTIEQLEVIATEVYEPWTETTMAFHGVRLRDLLELAGADLSTGEIELVALDEYTVQLPVPAIDDSVLVATRDAGVGPLALDDGGPTRLIFTDPDLAIADPDNWVWSIATITVR